MTKRALCAAVAALLTLFTIFSDFRVFAENGEEPEELLISGDLAGEASEPSTVEPTTEEIIPADFPALTVSVISNYFPTAIADYNAATREITVTYWINLGMRVLSTQWLMIYDPKVMTLSPEKNTPESICPSVGDMGVLSRVDEDTVKYCASNPALFNFSGKMTPFASFVFDLKELDPDEPATSKIDLMVDVLKVSDSDPATGLSDPEKELSLVMNSAVMKNSGLNFVKSDRTTTLTQSNFVQATTAPPVIPTDASGNPLNTPDEPVESKPVSSEPASAPASATVPIVTAETAPAASEPPDGNVDTGGTGTAFIVLISLIVATTVLFVMRKKGILY